MNNPQKSGRLYLLPALLLACLSTMSVFAEQEPGRQQYDFFRNQKTYIKDPFQLRDPFKRVEPKRQSQSKRSGKLFSDSFSNLPSIDNVPLEQIRIVGILLGSERRAIAKVTKGDNAGGETYFLKEGMKLGQNNAEIKAILPGGIVLVEKIRNVYDQDEYIETIIPVSN